MNKKLNTVISIIFILIIISGLIYFLKPKNKTLSSQLFIIKDTSRVTKVIIAQDSKKVVLTRNKTNRNWTVDGKYPANNKAIAKLYQSLTEVKISKPVLKSKTDSVEHILLSKGKRVRIYSSDNMLIKEIRIGSSDKKLQGTYMLKLNENTPFIVNIPGVENDLNYRYNINPVYWLKPEILSYSPNAVKEISLLYPDAISHSFKLEISEKSAKVYNLQNQKSIPNINLHKVGSYLSYFMNVKFAAETNDSERLRIKLLQKIPFAELKVTDINDKTKDLKLYKIPNNKEPSGFDMNILHAIINNNDVVIVKYVDFDLILKNINYFSN